ncbi:FecCD family ABC transporter permease [Paenibacillus sp. JCM 10914]|uniref:FecCD family ABC transporter permease n=1 Tax=Paenibacillus sp. JCM 10914 TaxID=1236974 RepID=UPI00351C0A73
MMNTTRKVMSISMILLLAIAAVFIVSLNMGTMKIPLAEVIKAFNGTGSEQNYTVLVHFRLPRMVIAILIGAGIAVSGAILQSISRNGLADPGILGINSGAGLAVVLYIFYFQGSSFSAGIWSVYIMPFAALLGAFVAAFLIYTLAWKQGVTPIRLVLVGIGINAAFAALIIVFQLMMDPNNFMQATIWLSGSIWGASWEYVYAILPWIVLLVPYALYQSQSLNVLNLGDHTATGLGLKVERKRRTLLLISVALAGACVAVGGGIAFLGLVAPHLARKLVGPRHQSMLPVSALLGSLVLLVSDMIGKNLMAPSEIPVGLVVSCLGAPYFIYLLIRD